ncbi:hypothetical protein GBP346_B2100 [Burkholderia pseudomallei MSHR346]|nr:hypothetical protein GBP346_B2100 [Burkholderia pseudomallei MSHR346]
MSGPKKTGIRPREHIWHSMRSARPPGPIHGFSRFASRMAARKTVRNNTKQPDPARPRGWTVHGRNRPALSRRMRRIVSILETHARKSARSIPLRPSLFRFRSQSSAGGAATG